MDQAILDLLAETTCRIGNGFVPSTYTRDVQVGPRLLNLSTTATSGFRSLDDLNPLVEVVSPLTPALGLRISTRARPNAQGTMALYLAEGGGSNRFLGLSCRHVLIGSQKGNLDYSYHPRAPAKDVLLLGKRAYADVVDSIKLVAGHGISAKCWRKQIEQFNEREKGNNAADVVEEASRITSIILTGPAPDDERKSFYLYLVGSSLNPSNVSRAPSDTHTPTCPWLFRKVFAHNHTLVIHGHRASETTSLSNMTMVTTSDL